MQLSTLFERCLSVPYIHLENDADFAAERLGCTLHLYFECSNGATDWKNNLDFPAKPYRHMDGSLWFAHGGFLKVWKSAEPHIATLLRDRCIRRVVIVGYSHGGALGVFCHEYVWFHRPDLRRRLVGYGFGCPRVVWGLPSPGLRKRWEGFTVVRNTNDLVTHLPPAVMGYTHVGKMLTIGQPGLYSSMDAHRPENILRELRRFEGAVPP